MKYKIHHALLTVYVMLIAGCAPVPYNPDYNKEAFSPAESPKVLILKPAVKVNFYEADFLLARLALGLEDSNVDNLTIQTEVKRIQKDSESIIHQYMDFFEIDYIPYDKLDTATLSINESTLADIQQVTYPDSLDDFGSKKPYYGDGFKSLYLASETIEDLAKFNADYVLSVNLGANYPNSYAIANDSPNASIDSRIVLFNATTGAVAWHNIRRVPNRTDSTRPRIDLDSIRWGWPLTELTSLGILTGKSVPIISEEANSTLKLKCLDVSTKRIGFDKLFGGGAGFQFKLSVNTTTAITDHKKIAVLTAWERPSPSKSQFGQISTILKVRQTADNLLLDTAFGDMLSINTNDYSGEWIGVNTKIKFTCSETSLKTIQSNQG